VNDATRDERVIKRMWTRYPQANIGGACAGLVAIDVDLKNGHRGWDEWQLINPNVTTYEQSTPTGGGHVVFKRPANAHIKNDNRGGLADGLDVKTNGGYILLAGSTIDGKPYTVANAAPIAPLPNALLALLTDKPKPTPTPAKVISTNGHGAYARKALANELANVRAAVNGTRNDTLNKAAFNLGTLVGAHELTRGEVESALCDAAIAIGLGERESRKTIESGVGDGMAQPRAIPERERVRRNGDGAGQSTATSDTTQADDAPMVDGAGQYLVKDGCLYRRKATQHGAVLVKLCNFAARITEEVASDDGAEVTRQLTIAGKHADGRTLPTARIDASQFAGMKWIAPQWGSKAIVEAGQSNQDHLRAAIQHQSSDVQARYVFKHTGWREVDGRRVFFTHGHTIGGGDGVAVELEKEMQRYELPAMPDHPKEAMQTSLRFLDVAPYRVTVPLWASMYLAPLSEIIPPKFLLWLYGTTGSMKSTLAALALCHFGEWTDQDLLLWSATANALEKYLFLAKDVPFVIDDFAPQSDARAATQLETTAARLVRDVGNRAGRARMNSDLSLRVVYRPRGLAISTGEQLPDGESLLARLVTLEVKKDDINVTTLTTSQDESLGFSHAMSGYVQWVGKRWDTLQKTLPAQFKEIRARIRQAGQHLRLPEALATLWLGFDLALCYAREIGALSPDLDETLRRDGWAALLNIGEQQNAISKEEKPTRRFLTILNELLAQGKVRLAELDKDAGGDGELLGWIDADYLYLLPSASYHRVAQYAKDEGRHFGVKENALKKALHEEGILVKIEDDPHYATPVRIGGKQQRVLKLSRAAVEKNTGGVLAKSGNSGNDD
jgi:hypothetical protein